MAVSWVALLGMMRTKVVLHRIRPLPLIATVLLLGGQIGKAFADAILFTIYSLFAGSVAVLILGTSILAH